MPFTDERPFLDAIAARYHEDGPRFIYADFLDDAGDPDRAELIRTQVALAIMDEDHPRRKELNAYQGELLAANKARWCEHLRDLVSPSECEFRRGLLDSVGINAAAFLEVGEELLRRIALHRIRLRDAASVLPKLATSPLLGRIRELDLCGNDLGNGGINLLARSPFLGELESLDLGFTGVDDVGVRTLARASTLPNLTSLSLNMNERITSAGLIELAESPFFAGLTAFDVSSADIDETGLQAVIESKTLTRLHTLRISENPIGDGGVANLVQSPLFGRMMVRSTRLELRSNEIGPIGAAALARCPTLGRCLSLDLTHNSIGDAGLSSLLRSHHLQKLRVLKVRRNLIGDAGINGLRDCLPQVFERLRLLDLSENRLTGHGIRTLESLNASGTTTIEVEQNVQAPVRGDHPVSMGDIVPGVLQGVSDAAALRRMVSHPSLRGNERPNSQS